MATSIKDAKFSQEGEPAAAAAIMDQYIPPMPNPPAAKKEGWVIFKLVKHKKGGTNVDGCDDVLGPDGKLQRIWLLTGVTSIWQKDLLDVLKDRDFMRTNRRSLRFINGVLRIPVWDTLAIEFARATRHNVGVKGDRDVSKQAFYEYDPAAQQKQMLEARMYRIRATTEASLMPEREMRMHASFLGIGFIDELGRAKTEDGIRTEYIIRAELDPTYWNNTKGTPQVERMFLIKTAIIDSKFDIGQGSIKWAKNGGFICHQPAGVTVHECLLDLVMSPSPEGKAFLQKLQTTST